MTDLKPCPVCGNPADVYLSIRDGMGLWMVGCEGCWIFVTDSRKDRAINMWNEINSRE